MKAHNLSPSRAIETRPIRHVDLFQGVDSRSDAADLGSDPNSAQRSAIRNGGVLELGSDPNYAGKSYRVFEFSFLAISPSSPYSVDANRFYFDSKIIRCANRRQLTMVRRIGVRAQFGGTPPASFIPFSRIGIRPQICFCAPDLSAAERLEVNCQPALDVDITVGDIPAPTHGAHHVHL